MKLKILFACLLTFTVNGVLWALPTTSVAVAWSPSPDTSVSGYKLYYSTTSASYTATNSIDVGNNLTFTLTRTTLVPGTLLYFVVTAYTAQGLESDFSNEISILIPRPPITLKISSTNVAISSYQGANLLVQSSPDLKTWNTFQNLLASADTVSVPIDTTKGIQFYRASYVTQVAQTVIAQTRYKSVEPAITRPPPVHLSKWRMLKLLLRYRPGHHADERKGAELLMAIGR